MLVAQDLSAREVLEEALSQIKMSLIQFVMRIGYWTDVEREFI